MVDERGKEEPDGRGPIDWTAIASVLGERCELPLVIVDGIGRVRLLNSSMERLLGRTRFELEGRTWLSVCAEPESHGPSMNWLNLALRGALRAYEVRVVSKTGARLALALEFHVIPGPAAPGLIMVASQWRAEPEPESDALPADLDYEVSLARVDYARLLHVTSRRTLGPSLPGADQCYRVLHGRGDMCEECPLRLRERGEPRPWTVVRPHAGDVTSEPTRHFEISTLEERDGEVGVLRIRTISESVLSALQKARVAQLSREAGLSARELSVLEYLLMGRSMEEIAGVLRISQRTVKFHQSNVLQKLGAESRVDLFRLVL